jgi:hypothetical protein
MAVRLKVVCNQVVEQRVSKTMHTKDGSQRLGGVSLSPVYSGSPENESFFNSTPSGKIEFTTINAKALEEFEPGVEYYVTIERVPTPEPEPETPAATPEQG